MIKLKNILSEAYAWERQEGKPLPTLKDVQEAYDAKGVEEAEAKPDYIDADGDGNEEESMKKAFADKEAKTNEGENGPATDGPIGYDDATDSYTNEDDSDSEETDLDVLNMGSLEESTFWGRVKGNLHGHEYILREAFRK